MKTFIFYANQLISNSQNKINPIYSVLKENLNIILIFQI